MNWHDYIACFFAGAFLANVVPHFVHGISGDRFPTPFAHPPGKGLSSPTVNVVWALFNLVVGYVLFRVGQVSSGHNLEIAIFFAGVVVELQDNLASLDLVLSGEQSKTPDGASQIELGFPQSIYERETVRGIRYGGVWDRLLL